MRYVQIPLSLVVLFGFNAVAQSDPWAPVRVFEGKWEGSVTGRPGKQLTSREYHFVSDGTFLWQYDHSVYEAKSPDTAPKVREDFGYFSYDKFLKTIVWRQFHSEGFINEYRLESVSDDGKRFEFVTVRIENLPPGWRARKSYRVLSTDEIEETFSLAAPEKEFDTYTVAHLNRVK
jgi:hypothetical protein